MKKSENIIVGIFGKGEIGGAMASICKDASYQVLIREISYDQIKSHDIDYLHINIPEKKSSEFIKIAVKNIREIKPKLTIINSSVSPGVTRKIYKLSKNPIVHSPVIGLHPHLKDSIMNYFPKIIGPIDEKSKRLAISHFKKLGLKTEVYSSPEDSEAAKLLDLVYYAWNIIFCKWMKEVSEKNNLDFENIYIRQNEIYNNGYKKLLPNVVRPILTPVPGPIGGHCTISDTELFHKYYDSEITKFILNTNKKYARKNIDMDKERKKYIKVRDSKREHE